MKILIVEDDVNSRVYLERLLISRGYSVESAGNGMTALKKAEKSAPDLIISDIMMPEMDGFELCRRVKSDEHLCAIPFVFYTATYIEPKDEKLAMSLGASRFLVKPMELDDLFRAIEAVIDEHCRRNLEVPLQPLAAMKDLDRMQLEVLARKLDKKVGELEEEREALRRSENKYRKLLESMMDGFVYVDMDGTIREYNETYKKMLGYDDEELKRLTFYDITPEKWHEFERKTIDERILKQGFSEVYEKQYLKKDGTAVPVELHTFLIRSDQGDNVGMWAIVRDITERKRAENLLAGQKRVLEMIATDAPQNETLAALMSFLESGSRGLKASILLLDEDGVHVRHGAAQSLPEAYIKAVDGAPIGPRAGSCGTAMFRHEPVIVTDILHDPLWEDYRDLIVPYGLRACWSTPILSHDGRVLGSFAIYYDKVRSPAPEEKQLVDIATHIASIAIEHYRADQKIRSAASAAEAANRTKSQFLANMSHELRTPMTGVLGMLEITLGGPLEEEQREFIATAHKSAGSLVRILNDILEMTKIEAGMLSLEEKPFVLHECVGSVIDIFNSEARHKGLNLVLLMTDDLPERVVGDCLRVRQVLTNLVGNAVKFTERGKVEVKVAKGNITPSGKREFTFSVTDTGIGIPEDKKHLVFRFFSQVDESHTRKYTGTGLGLVISKEIVERMGGTITFDCEEGAGCDFSFTVPLGEAGSEPYSETADRRKGPK